MKTIKSLAAMLLAVNLLASFAYGASVSYDDAKNVALNLIYSKTGKSVTIDDSVHDSGTSKELHIIRLKPKGWVIVSGDESIEPIIAWSTESSLGSSDSLPAGFVAWMDTVEKQIREAKDADTKSNAALEEKWKKLTAYPEDFRVDGTSYRSNDSYVQDVILDISTEGSGTESATASGGVVADGWYAVDVTADSSGVDYGESLASDGSVEEEGSLGADEPLGGVPPPVPTNIKASKGTYERYVLITMYGNSKEYSYVAYFSESLNGPRSFCGRVTKGNLEIKSFYGQQGKKYYYTVYACNWGCSDHSAPDIGWRGTAPTPTKPATPTNISASKGTYTTGVMISNYSVSNATGYKIYRDDISKGLTTGLRILDTTAEVGKYYNYSVKANNSAGDSLMSASDKGWRGYPTPAKPATPSISATKGTLTSGVVIKFYSAKAASYKVYRNGGFIKATTGTSYKDTEVYPGKKYTYSAKACNSSKVCSGLAYDTGWRKKTESTVPATPSISATKGTLTSGVVIKFYSAKAASYKVYRNGGFIKATTGTSYKDTEVYPGKKYTYSAKACNSSKVCSGLAYNTGWRKSDIPAAPKGVSATKGTLTSGVVIKWGSVSGAVQYLIYRDGGYIGATGGTSYKDEKAQNGTKYYYSVKSKNKARVKSAMSASDRGWRKSDIPATPTGVSATKGTLLSGVNIKWSSVSGATHYKLYKIATPVLANPLKFVKAVISTSYKDTTAWPDYEYYYYVKACNSSEVCSDYSKGEMGWIKGISAPSNVKASRDLVSGIQISYSSVNGAKAYNIYRSKTLNSQKEYCGTSKETSYKDTDTTPNYTYYYFVIALYNSHNNSEYSRYAIGEKARFPAPTNIRASDSLHKSGVIISNYTVAGADYYKIYRAKSSSGGKKEIKWWTNRKSYLDDTAWPDYKYYYFVKACLGYNCSNFSKYNVGMREK